MNLASPRIKNASSAKAGLAFLLLWLAVPATTVGQSPISQFEGLSVVSWSKAKQFVGQTAVVTGKIVAVGKAGRVNFLNFDAQRRDVFKIVVFRENLENFEGTLSDLYQDQLIAVKGRVTLYKDVPQIEVASMDQIQVVQKLPKSQTVEKQRRRLTNQVRIATFNVRNLFDDVDDPYFADETTQAKPRAELERLAATINELDADVLSLQEVENRGYLQRFNDVFLGDMGYEVVHYAGNDQRGSGLAVLTRVPVGRVTSHRHRSFKDPNGKYRRFSRDLLCVELLHPLQPAFEVWVTHCKSKRGGAAETEPQRVAETQQIRKILAEKLVRESNARILVMGDFNDTADSKPIQTLVQGQQLKTFTDGLDAGAVTYNLPPYQAMIDFIFASPQAAAGYIANSYEIVDRQLEQSGSDHNPVVAEFRF